MKMNTERTLPHVDSLPKVNVGSFVLEERNMKVEFDMPIAIGDTIYSIERMTTNVCCGCPNAGKIKNGVCDSDDGICGIQRIKPIKVESYAPYVRFVENTIELYPWYFKTKEEAIKSAENRADGYNGFNGGLFGRL